MKLIDQIASPLTKKVQHDQTKIMLRGTLLGSPVINCIHVQETDQDQTKIMLTNILIRIPVIN